MSRDRRHPRLVLITGIAGTGKSTLADVAAERLDASVLGWDWAMAALTEFPRMQNVLRSGSHEEYRAIGWAILRSLAIAQLRQGRSVVLDGVARTPEMDLLRQVAADAEASMLIVVTRCTDVEVHRSRVDGRRRAIPGWHELEWRDVASQRDRWTPPEGADLYLDAVDPLEDNIERIGELLERDGFDA